LGEIDIIAEQGGVLVFIEVKAISGHQYGHPFNAVTPSKQLKIMQVAQAFSPNTDCWKSRQGLMWLV
jgi:putative endonuclease